jgi:NADPH:quinone reductase
MTTRGSHHHERLATDDGRMDAVVLDQFGGVDRLTTRRVPIPEVGDNDVLIRVHAAGVGSWDAIERRGDWEGLLGTPTSFPFILGWDAAGTVAAVGRNVTRFSVGDRVYAGTIPVERGGFYAEFGVVDAEFVAPVPRSFPILQAGALAWDALTALVGLDRLELAPGASLMVFGASGGIGHLALQLARVHGLRVFAVASGNDGVALAHRLGAEHVVDGRRDDVVAAAFEMAPKGLDSALVTVGGATTERALTAVKADGRIAWPNGVAPALSSLPRAEVILYDGDRSRATTDRLNAIIEANPFEVQVARTFRLEQARAAHRALEGHYVGKLVMTVMSATSPPAVE